MTRRAGSVVLVLAMFLAACSGGSDPEESGGPAAATDPATVVARSTVTVGPAVMDVQVLPLVRTPQGLVLTLDITVVDPSGSTSSDAASALSTPWSSRNMTNLPEWTGLRLLDLAGDRVVPPAVDASDDSVVIEPEAGPDGGTQRMQVAYGDPGVDELALFLPQGGVVPGIPVIDGEVPAVEGAEALDLAQIVSAPVHPMTSYSVDVASTTRTEAAPEKVRISLGSDVLFATDSATLNPAASKVVAAAATEIGSRSPGPVQVVGHTDSEGVDGYNQKLSERRAAAVADSLRGLIDTQVYPLQVSGRGESAPVASNASVEGRTENRRVELVIETAAKAEAADQAADELVAIEGPTATGAEGLTIDINRPWRVRAPRAFVVDGHLMVEIQTEAQDDKVKSAIGPAIYEGSFPRPEELETLRSMGGLAVMNGSVGTVPVLHQPAGSEADVLVPLTDLATFSRLDGGNVRTSVVVYPRGLEIGDTVTLDLLGVYLPGWRLTDIPVEQA